MEEFMNINLTFSFKVDTPVQLYQFAQLDYLG